MDENNFLITTLHASPQYKEDLLKLIESEFNYPGDQSYQTDFYPLFNLDNYKNLHLIIDIKNKTPVAHIGVHFKEITYAPLSLQYEVALLGGIVTHPQHRGKGLFQKLINSIHQQYSAQLLFFILWSDLSEMYVKYEYHQLGVTQQVGTESLTLENIPHHFKKVKLKELSTDQRNQIKNLYLKSNSQFLSFTRNDHDWSLIEKISSSNLYIHQEESKIIEYFFYEKGADLNDIIHEYYIIDWPAISHLKVWKPTCDPILGQKTIYSALFKIANKSQAIEFIKNISKDQIQINSIIEPEIKFTFKHQDYRLSINDFLQGLFGPNYIPDFQHFKIPIFFSGLDSI